MRYLTIEDLSVRGRRVLLRLDLNVPLVGGQVEDRTRIEEALPGIRRIVELGGLPIVASHLGRPGGKPDATLSLRPLAGILEERLGLDVIFSETPAGVIAERLARELAPGQVLLLENLRFDPGEETNSEEFSKALASLASVYVNDAFGTAHRAHASTVGVTRFLPDRGMGPLMRKEIEALSPLLDAPEHPFVIVLGGAKVSDKIGVIRNLFDKLDALLIGGAMAYTFLRAQGISVGRSLLANVEIPLAGEILEEAERRHLEVVLPVDHLSVMELEDTAASTGSGPEIPVGRIGVDVGPKTIKLFAERAQDARTIFWNGPLGIFEIGAFSRGTFAMAEAIARSPAWSVVGGGDSVAAVVQSGQAPFIGHISTGGGASLELLEGHLLPGLEALEG